MSRMKVARSLKRAESVTKPFTLLENFRHPCITTACHQGSARQYMMSYGMGVTRGR